MIEAPPSRFPKVMPMTSAVAPQFSAAHPRAAVIFDNLHMTHDIISDILAADTVPAGKKREVIYAALDRMQDSTRDVMTMEEWWTMGEMMGGIALMGGPASGILPEVSTAGAEAPMAMAGMDHGSMMAQMRALHRRLLADPIIRERVEADTVLHRMLAEMMMSREPADSMPMMLHHMPAQAPSPSARSDSARTPVHQHSPRD
jgi:hypothetical protein